MLYSRRHSVRPILYSTMLYDVFSGPLLLPAYMFLKIKFNKLIKIVTYRMASEYWKCDTM